MQTGRREAERRVGLGGRQTLGELQDSGGEQEAVTELIWPELSAQWTVEK